METPVLTLLTLPGLHISFVLTKTVLMGVFSLFSVFYFIVTCVLFYHWISYGMGSKGIIRGEILFLVVSVLLFVLTFLSASYY